jgi:lysophospholipase L1-like esterase
MCGCLWRVSIIYDKKRSNSIEEARTPRARGMGMGTAVGRPRRASGALHACAWLCAPLLAQPALAASPPVHEAKIGGRGLARCSLTVPEGNYRVTVRLTGPNGSTVALFAEQRRLMLENIRLAGEQPVIRSFVVNVRKSELAALPANATGGTSVRLKPREIGSASWDDRLSIEVTPPGLLRGLRAEPIDVPTLYLAGDSTVTDQVAPNGSWGQFLTRYFGDGIAVANHAESGETLKSFVSELRLDKLLEKLRPGDWVMIQFGHNDQKTQWPQTFADAATTYRYWLRTYIAEIRRRGGTPLLVTSPERRNFDAQGRIVPTLGEYPAAVRAVAGEEHEALIDLNPMSVSFYEALGPEVSPRAFADAGRDQTHHNEYGARMLARMVVESLRAATPALTAGLEKHLAADAGRFDPAHPPLPN